MIFRNNKDIFCMEGNNGRKEFEYTAHTLRKSSKSLGLRQHGYNSTSTSHRVKLWYAPTVSIFKKVTQKLWKTDHPI